MDSFFTESGPQVHYRTHILTGVDLVPVTVVVGRNVYTVTVVRGDHRVLAGVRLAAGAGNLLITYQSIYLVSNLFPRRS